IATQLARYHWVHVGTYVLSEGGHRIGVGAGEEGLRLDCLVLDPVGLEPAELDELVGAPPHVEPEPEPEPTPEPGPPVTPPGALWQVDPTFDPSNPTRRDGAPLTVEQRHYYEAFTRAFL